MSRAEEFAAWTRANRRAGRTRRLTSRELMLFFSPNAPTDNPVWVTRLLHKLNEEGVCLECKRREELYAD